MPKRVDHNQAMVVQALREAGATVQHLHIIGKGCPDILVGYRGANFVIEIKSPSQPPSKRKLTPDEQRWHDSWQGQKAVVDTISGALAVIGAA